jgi:hypothetical protein
MCKIGNIVFDIIESGNQSHRKFIGLDRADFFWFKSQMGNVLWAWDFLGLKYSFSKNQAQACRYTIKRQNARPVCPAQYPGVLLELFQRKMDLKFKLKRNVLNKTSLHNTYVCRHNVTQPRVSGHPLMICLQNAQHCF